MIKTRLDIKRWRIIVAILAFIVVALHAVGFFLIYKQASKKFPVPYMTSYRGSTSLITGRVIYDEYSSGPIFVIAKRTPRDTLIPDIAMSILPSPGVYTIKVPSHIDKVSLIAVNSQEPYSGLPFAPSLPSNSFSKNPIRIQGRRVLKNVDIVIH